jgi:glycosyltransferase involved in cell wall biosynthesis
VSGLRVVITADPYIPVPPVVYGGIERVVELVVNGLVQRGHDVTLIAHPDSHTAARLIPYGSPPHRTPRARITELVQVGRALWQRRNRTDVVLSWGRLMALAPILPLRHLPKVQRYCRAAVPWNGVRKAVALAGDSLTFAGASASVYDELPSKGAAGGRWVTVYDGIDTTRYHSTGRVPADAPIVFLGRLLPEKGVEHAITAARIARRTLVIAGNIDAEPHNVAYYDTQIAPHIDGERVQYIGPVDDRAKSELLGRAGVALFPSQSKEGFGLVMAEAMACGTPVIAFPVGSVPEIVRPGMNGFVARDAAEMAAFVEPALRLDRAAIRNDCVARFDAERTIDAFENLLHEAIARVQ